MQENERFLRIDEVMHLTGLSRSTIYDNARAGKFPQSVPLGGGAKAWLESEIKEWMQSRIKQRNNKTTQAGNQ